MYRFVLLNSIKIRAWRNPANIEPFIKKISNGGRKSNCICKKEPRNKLL